MPRPEENLIYDRNRGDILISRRIHRAYFEKGFQGLSPAEQQMWTRGLRGCLNVGDLNRIGKWCEYLYQEYNTRFGSALGRYTARVWAIGDPVYRSDIQSLVASIVRLADAVTRSGGTNIGQTELDKNPAKMTLGQLNQMEYTLYRCDEFIHRG